MVLFTRNVKKLSLMKMVTLTVRVSKLYPSIRGPIVLFTYDVTMIKKSAVDKYDDVDGKREAGIPCNQKSSHISLKAHSHRSKAEAKEKFFFDV